MYGLYTYMCTYTKTFQLGIFLTFKNIYLFIWPCRVFVVAGRVFSCGMWTLSWGMWDLVPWPGIELEPLPLEASSLSHSTAREVPGILFFPSTEIFFGTPKHNTFTGSGMGFQMPRASFTQSSFASIHSLWGNAVKSWGSARQKWKPVFGQWMCNVHFLGISPLVK